MEFGNGTGASLSGGPQIVVAGRRWATRSEVLARNGMAATSQPLATQVAVDVLKKGGSAVDGAIAANAMLGLVEPVSCGIGGDLFALVWDAGSGTFSGLNGSGRSPLSLELAELKRRGLDRLPSRGPLSVSVPGCVDGWYALHSRFGRLPMEQLLAPTVEYARQGFPVSEVIAGDWEKSVAIHGKWPGFLETFTLKGRAPRAGEVFTNPRLAATLERIGRSGREAFYQGEIPRRIEAYFKELGGFLSARDLADHRSEWVEPVATDYRGYRVWQLPPNGQGIAVLQMLNLLEAYDIASMGFGTTDHIHHFVEAKKLVFEDRARFYADPAFNQIPVRQLISKAYADERCKLLDSDQAGKSFDAGNPALGAGDTVYLTVADAAGNMVSFIQSNFMGMGSGMTPEGLGFMLQNRGELFTLEEGHFNCYEPHKRPFHTIIPGFVTRKGRPVLSFGVMGGDFQALGQVQVLLNLIEFGMNLQEAGDAPRINHDGSSSPTGDRMADGGVVELERGFSRESVDGLVRRGHRVTRNAGPFGGYQAIGFDPDCRVYRGASESRKDGQAAGY